MGHLLFWNKCDFEIWHLYSRRCCKRWSHDKLMINLDLTV